MIYVYSKKKKKFHPSSIKKKQMFKVEVFIEIDLYRCVIIFNHFNHVYDFLKFLKRNELPL